MSTPITEAHREAAVAIFAIAMKSAHHGAAFREPCAQLIADSEAAAVQTAMLREYGNLCATNEGLAKERDQFRAEVERRNDIINRASVQFFHDGGDGETAAKMLTVLNEAKA